MTREQETLLEKLLQLAGEPGVVETVIKELNHDLGRPPTVREIVRAILEHQQSRPGEALEKR